MYFYDPYFVNRQQPPRPPVLPISPQSVQPQMVPYAISPQSIQPQPVQQQMVPYAISPQSVQPQPIWPQPTWPQPTWPQPVWPPPTTTGGCNQKWATMRLRDGRTLNIFVTSIAEKSLGGFLPNGQQMAIDLDEIMEMTC